MNNKNLVIAIDSGKMNMKARCGDKELIYRNHITIGKHSDAMQKGNLTWNVTWNGCDYTVGDTADKYDIQEGKATSEHILNSLTAITRFLEPNTKYHNIVVIYGESVDMYFNEEHKAEIVKALTGYHTLTVDNKMYTFDIAYTHVLPEAIGNVLLNPANYKGKRHLIDIGGKTINFLTVNNGRPVEDESISCGLGMRMIARRLMIDTKKDKKCPNMDASRALEILENGSQDINVARHREEAIKFVLSEFETSVGAYDIDLKSLIQDGLVTFVGGGATALKGNILAVYPQAQFIQDSILANVRGFYLYGTKKFDTIDKLPK